MPFPHATVCQQCLLASILVVIAQQPVLAWKEYHHILVVVPLWLKSFAAVIAGAWEVPEVANIVVSSSENPDRLRSRDEDPPLEADQSSDHSASGVRGRAVR